MTVRIPKEGTRIECGNWRSFFVLPAVVKILADIILEYIEEHLKSLVDMKQVDFRAESFCADQTNAVQIIVVAE